MTGPGHYVASEKKMQHAEYLLSGGNGELAKIKLIEAQVHATLALAAATAMNGYGTDEGPMSPSNYAAWAEVSS